MTVSTGYEFRPRLELIVKLLLVVFSLHLSRLSFRIKKRSIYRYSDCVAVVRVDCASIQKTPEPKKVRLSKIIRTSTVLLHNCILHIFSAFIYIFTFSFSEWICHPLSNLLHHQSNTHQWGTMMSPWLIFLYESCTFVLTNRGPHIYWLEDFCWKSSLKIKILSPITHSHAVPNQTSSVHLQNSN